MNKFVSKSIGKDKIDRAMAYEYLCKGFGVHEIPENHPLKLEGFNFARVKSFINWEECEDNQGYIDVVFLECVEDCSKCQDITYECGKKECHFEFQITCTGLGGTPLAEV